MYIELVIMINIDKIKATESLHILHSNSEKSYFKGHYLKPQFLSYLPEKIYYLIFIVSMIPIQKLVH